MTIKGKIVAIVAGLTCIALIAPGVVQGLTAEELQQQITDLTTQLQALQNQLSVLEGTPTTPITPTTAISGCTITSFDRNLKQGMTGDDVKCLQIVLNSAADTKLAASGVGSSGNETSYFGPLTKAAVIKFQEKYASEVLASWGLTAGTGFVGTTTRTKLNSLLVVTPPITPPEGCECTVWANVACGSGTCSASQMQQTRTCTPAACAVETQCVADSSCVVTPPGAGLTVSLAADNPAAGTIIAAQSLASLAKFKLTNGDNVEVKVTKIKLARTGVSGDTTLSNVYLFDGAIRLTDAASVSSGIITFTDSTGIVKIPAGGSKTISVESDILTGTNGQTVGVTINSGADITSDASSVSGTFPIAGNIMSIASKPSNFATVDFNTSTTPTDASIDPQNDYTVWQNIVTVGNWKVNMTRLSLREIGTIVYADLSNFRLYVDGVEVAKADKLDANGYVTFDLTANPKELRTSHRTLKVLGDIIAGSSRTFSFSLRKASDATFVDAQYGAKVLATAAGSTFSARTSGTQEVNQGVVTITKLTDSPSGEVILDANSILLAKYEVKAAGEAVKIETLQVSIVTSNTSVNELRNGMVLANGTQVGSTADINAYATSETATYTEYSLGSSLIVEPGSPVTLEVYADLYDSDSGGNDLVAADTVKVRIEGTTSNAQGQISSAVINVPSADVDANTLTVRTGGLTMAKYAPYPSKTVVAPLTNFKVGWFTLTANTTEAVNLNSIDVDFTVTNACSAADDLSNLYLKYGDQVTSTKATVTASNNQWAINYELAKGASINVEVYTNIASGATDGTGGADTLRADVKISGTTVSSASSVNTGASNIQGQTFTFSSGSLTASEVQTPVEQIVAGNQTVTAANFNLTSAYESFTLKEVQVKVTDTGAASAIAQAVLKDGTTEIARGALTGDVSSGVPTSRNFTGLSIAIPSDSTKKLTVDLVLAEPSADLSPRTSNVNAKVTLDQYKKANSQGVEEVIGDDENTCSSADCLGNNVYVYKSVPTFTKSTIASTAKPSGNTSEGDVYSFKVGANKSGAVALKQLKFAVSWSDAGTADTLELEGFKLYRGTTNITDLVAIQTASGSDLEVTAGTQLTESLSAVVITWSTEDKIEPGDEFTYTLKATPQGFRTANAQDVAPDSVALYLQTDSSADTTNFYLNAGTSVTSVTKLYSSSTASGSATNYNIIWSDCSALAHPIYPGTVGTNGTADWSNGHLVLNLPLSSESLNL